MSATNKIEWTSQRVPMPDIDTDLLARWLDAVAREHGRLLGSLTYIFCDDERIIEVNREFLQHDYYTDIITFDYSIGKLIRGDMFISLDTVATNADLVKAAYTTELHRVIAHGVLHLCGINDKGPGEREIMEAHENRALDLLEEMQNK